MCRDFASLWVSVCVGLCVSAVHVCISAQNYLVCCLSVYACMRQNPRDDEVIEAELVWFSLESVQSKFRTVNVNCAFELLRLLQL